MRCVCVTVRVMVNWREKERMRECVWVNRSEIVTLYKRDRVGV